MDGITLSEGEVSENPRRAADLYGHGQYADASLMGAEPDDRGASLRRGRQSGSATWQLARLPGPVVRGAGRVSAISTALAPVMSVSRVGRRSSRNRCPRCAGARA